MSDNSFFLLLLNLKFLVQALLHVGQVNRNSSVRLKVTTNASTAVVSIPRIEDGLQLALINTNMVTHSMVKQAFCVCSTHHLWRVVCLDTTHTGTSGCMVCSVKSWHKQTNTHTKQIINRERTEMQCIIIYNVDLYCYRVCTPKKKCAHSWTCSQSP